MPLLLAGSVSGMASNRPAMQFSGAQQLSGAASSATTSQPISYGSVANRTYTSNGGIIAGNNGNDAELRYNTSTTVIVFAGTSARSQTVTNNAFHAIAGQITAASAVANVDGSSGTSGTTGSNGVTSFLRIGQSPLADFLTGYICESRYVDAVVQRRQHVRTVGQSASLLGLLMPEMTGFRS